MINENKAFISYGNPVEGIIFDDSNHNKYPLKYYNVIDGNGFEFNDNSSYFIYVYDGQATLNIDNGIVSILPINTYVALKDNFKLTGKFKAILIEIINKGYYLQTNYKPYTTIGGPIEEVGRLKYIDGCTDSLLINPVKKGDPCLNHLHFPKGIIQTPHTHPSHRIGIVVKGRGECVTPFGNLPLETGCIFVIKEYNGSDKSEGLDGNLYENGTHKFNTYESSMDVIAFHPDSDFGAEDEFHPMINRTIVNGISANSIDTIKTK